MSGTPSTNEWYIARDGVQHGPVSDAEMRKFIDLGHLRAADLVWCARFTAWQSGAQAFPEHFQPTSPSAPVQQVAPSPAVLPNPTAAPARDPRVQPTTPRPVQPTTAAPVSENAAWAQAMRAAVTGPAMPTAPSSAQTQFTQTSAQTRQSAHVASQPGMQAAPATASTPAIAISPQPVAPFAAPFAGMQALAPMPSLQGHLLPGALQSAPLHGPHDIETFDHAHDPDPEETMPPPRRGWIGVATAAFAVILIVGGLGWFGWQNRSIISGASAVGSAISSATQSLSGGSSGSAGPVETFRAPPYSAPGETKEEIDASLQRIAIWRYLKRQFADWYEERVVEIERMRAQKRDERVITQYMVDVIVTLRRRFAQSALQASPEHLRAMSTAFVTNLKQLGSRDGATCYAFITHGETSPFMIELSNTPAFAETLQKQMISVFQGVVDARSNKKVHAATRREDYIALTGELTQRGWTQQDLATFSDPQRLSTTLPDKVCQLVQQWFVTQLALKDTELQTRLLAESLKPLVGG